MNTYDNTPCLECGFIGEPEKVFEFKYSLESDLEKENIVLICSMCGCAVTRGERINGEEFYF